MSNMLKFAALFIVSFTSAFAVDPITVQEADKKAFAEGVARFPTATPAEDPEKLKKHLLERIREGRQDAVSHSWSAKWNEKWPEMWLREAFMKMDTTKLSLVEAALWGAFLGRSDTKENGRMVERLQEFGSGEKYDTFPTVARINPPGADMGAHIIVFGTHSVAHSYQDVQSVAMMIFYVETEGGGLVRLTGIDDGEECQVYVSPGTWQKLEESVAATYRKEVREFWLAEWDSELSAR